MQSMEWVNLDYQKSHKDRKLKEKLVYIVEDELDIAELLKLTLIREGYKVEHFADGTSFINKIKTTKPNLVLLDLMLPDMGGLEICKLLKTDLKLDNLPLVMVTAKGDEQDVVKGLEAGADDYITKPFSPKILVSRLKTILKRESRSTPNPEGLVIRGPISIHKGRFEVAVSDKKVKLTKSEFSILLLLSSHPGWVYSRAQIVDTIRGDNYAVTERTVDFQMVGLRKKLGDAGKYIETVRGVGYKFID